MAASWICVFTEATLVNAFSVYGPTVDFVKLYNSICPKLAGQVAKLQGLSDKTVDQLLLPILASYGYWRLGEHACAPTIHTERERSSTGTI